MIYFIIVSIVKLLTFRFLFSIFLSLKIRIYIITNIILLLSMFVIISTKAHQLTDSIVHSKISFGFVKISITGILK